MVVTSRGRRGMAILSGMGNGTACCAFHLKGGHGNAPCRVRCLSQNCWNDAVEGGHLCWGHLHEQEQIREREEWFHQLMQRGKPWRP